MKRVDFFAWRPLSNASARCRGAAYIPYLAREGIALRILTPASEAQARLLNRRRGLAGLPLKLAYHGLVLLRRIRQVWQARHADAVIVQRELFSFGPPFLERWLARLNPRLIYEFDDAVDLKPPHLAGFVYRFHDRDKLRHVAALSRHLVASTSLLAERVADLGRPLSVIPTPVDPERYPSRVGARREGRLALGWIGTGGNLHFLAGIAGVLREVQAEAACDLIVISEWDFECEGLRVVNLGWSLEREAEFLGLCDIGLMPLEDNPYTRAKAGYKILQYWAAGLPVVASPVGFNRELISEGEDGFLAAGHDEWRRALLLLLGDAGLRRRLGEAGRRKVAEGYSVELWAREWARILTTVMS